jgi:hypothetical protein
LSWPFSCLRLAPLGSTVTRRQSGRSGQAAQQEPSPARRRPLTCAGQAEFRRAEAAYADGFLAGPGRRCGPPGRQVVVRAVDGEPRIWYALSNAPARRAWSARRGCRASGTGWRRRWRRPRGRWVCATTGAPLPLVRPHQEVPAPPGGARWVERLQENYPSKGGAR